MKTILKGNSDDKLPRIHMTYLSPQTSKQSIATKQTTQYTKDNHIRKTYALDLKPDNCKRALSRTLGLAEENDKIKNQLLSLLPATKYNQ
jgi:hypothetical protein